MKLPNTYKSLRLYAATEIDGYFDVLEERKQRILKPKTLFSIACTKGSLQRFTERFDSC